MLEEGINSVPAYQGRMYQIISDDFCANEDPISTYALNSSSSFLRRSMIASKVGTAP